MEFSINTLNTYVDTLNEVLSSVESPDGSKAVAEIRDNALVITVTGADGTVRTLPIPDPELEAPKDVDLALLDSALAKLSEIREDLGISDEEFKKIEESAKALVEKAFAAGGGRTGASGKTGKMLFDLYALMVLLAEAFREQREVAREARQTATILIQKNFEAQAHQQVTDAIIGMVCSLAVCVIQSVLAIRNLKQAGTSLKQQLDASKNSGFDMARTQEKIVAMEGDAAKIGKQANLIRNENPALFDQVKGDLESAGDIQGKRDALVKAEGQLKAAELREQITGLEKEVGDLRGDVVKLKGEVKASEIKQKIGVDEIKEEDVGLEDDLEESKSEAVKLEESKSEIKPEENLEEEIKLEDEGGGEKKVEGEAKPEEVKPEEKQAELEKKKTELSTKEGQLADLKKQLSELEGKFGKPEGEPGIDKLRENVQLCRENLRAEYEMAYDITNYERAYNSALSDYNGAIDNGDQPTPEQIEALQTAEYNLKAAQVLRSEALTKAPKGVFGKSAFVADQKMAAEATRRAQDKMTSDTSYRKAALAMTQAEAWNAIYTQIGNCLQGLIQMGLKFGEAEVTKLQGQEKLLEEQRAGGQDLYDDSKQVANAVLQLLQAVNQAEIQSMRDIIA